MFVFDWEQYFHFNYGFRQENALENCKVVSKNFRKIWTEIDIVVMKSC